jgi:hypothetical protein
MEHTERDAQRETPQVVSVASAHGARHRHDRRCIGAFAKPGPERLGRVCQRHSEIHRHATRRRLFGGVYQRHVSAIRRPS